MASRNGAGKAARIQCLARIAAILLLLGGPTLAAQTTAPAAPTSGPKLVLQPGEALAITLGDDEVGEYGDAKVEVPMGGLAELLWLRLEGADWSARHLQYRCTGVEGPLACSVKTGHGRVDVGKALQEGCDLAFLAWIRDAQKQWRQDFGEAAAWSRMEEVFGPFLGRRLPPGERLPPLTPAWVGQGDLLQTSPEAMLRWLMAPDQGEVVVFGTRFLAGRWSEFSDLLGKANWWFKTATVPSPGEPSATSAWVVGGRGNALLVYHSARGRDGKAALARVQEIMKQPPR